MINGDWAELELAPWRGVNLAGLDVQLNAVADNDPTTAIYRIERGRVHLMRLDADRLKPAKRKMILTRSELYRSFLQEVVTSHQIGQSALLAMRLDDRGAHTIGTPIFAFQKRRFETVLLLPDVDLIASDLTTAVDARLFDDKRAEAVFVGATTGGIISAEVLANDAHGRIRSAMYFRDKVGVTFLLPAIVQCDTPETRAAVEAMRLGDRRWDWSEQLDYRYLISADGNGATCSRVVRALASNSVLLKYASANLLYYFHGLTPWVHYVPVLRDADVIDIVDQSSRTVERDRAIALEGQRFVKAHLGRAEVVAYAARLIAGYASIARAAV